MASNPHTMSTDLVPEVNHADYPGDHSELVKATGLTPGPPAQAPTAPYDQKLAVGIEPSGTATRWSSPEHSDSEDEFIPRGQWTTPSNVAPRKSATPKKTASASLSNATTPSNPTATSTARKLTQSSFNTATPSTTTAPTKMLGKTLKS
ncbi:hypothetical protein OH77DRAFT_444024 [Trametes cingulata]|nr:hypothetical protein OH77DRAFT_444024 [Trametes cingulata]